MLAMLPPHGVPEGKLVQSQGLLPSYHICSPGACPAPRKPGWHGRVRIVATAPPLPHHLPRRTKKFVSCRLHARSIFHSPICLFHNPRVETMRPTHRVLYATSCPFVHVVGSSRRQDIVQLIRRYREPRELASECRATVATAASTCSATVDIVACENATLNLPPFNISPRISQLLSKRTQPRHFGTKSKQWQPRTNTKHSLLEHSSAYTRHSYACSLPPSWTMVHDIRACSKHLVGMSYEGAAACHPAHETGNSTRSSQQRSTHPRAKQASRTHNIRSQAVYLLVHPNPSGWICGMLARRPARSPGDVIDGRWRRRCTWVGDRAFSPSLFLPSCQTCLFSTLESREMSFVNPSVRLPSLRVHFGWHGRVLPFLSDHSS